MNEQEVVARSNPDGHQQGRKRWIGVIAAGFVVAVLFGANGPLGGFWGGDSGTADEIPGGALAGLITAGLIEAVAFGVGLAWLAFGWAVVRNIDRGSNRTGNRTLALATYVAVGWALVSWSPHTSFHQSWTEDDWYGLVAIELGFHATLVIGAFIVATFVWRSFREARVDQPNQRIPAQV